MNAEEAQPTDSRRGVGAARTTSREVCPQREVSRSRQALCSQARAPGTAATLTRIETPSADLAVFRRPSLRKSAIVGLTTSSN